MPDPADTAADTLGYYAFVLRRKWTVVVAFIAIGGLAAFGYLELLPQAATARTDVNINIISVDPFNATKQAASLLDGVTEAQIATSYSVAERAATTIGGGVTPAGVRKGIQMNAVSGGSIAQIKFTAESADEAREGADAVANAYLEFRTSRAQEKRDSILEGVNQRLETLREELGQANVKIASDEAGSTAVIQATSDRDLITISLNGLLSQKSELERIDTSGGSVLTSAFKNGVNIEPNKLRTLATGLLAGGVLGILLAFLVHKLDKRMRTSREVEWTTGAPLLAIIDSPDANIPEQGDSRESLREARERIFAYLPPKAKALAIVDDRGGDEISDIPTNLAIAMAEVGRLVELILTRTTREYQDFLGRALNLGEEKGQGDLKVRESLSIEGLRVVFPPTPPPRDEDDTFIPKVVRRLMMSNQGEYLSIVVLGPAASRSDILAAQRISDAVLLLVYRGESRGENAREIISGTIEYGNIFLGTIIATKRRRLADSVDAPVKGPRLSDAAQEM